MNILVTGANGQLGTELRNVTAGSRDNYIFSDVVSADGVHTFILDITDLRAVRKACATLEVDVIINCAAYTNVDMAEEDPQSAMTLNASAPANLAVAASETGAFLIQISTDYVFRGDASVPYRMALFPLRIEFRQDHAAAHCREGFPPGGLGPDRVADLCAGSGIPDCQDD